MKSYRTSVVGAMTEPARASRKFRSTVRRRPKAGAAARAHGQVGDLQGGLRGRRLAFQQRQQRVRPRRFHPAGDVLQEGLLGVHGDLHLGQPGAQGRAASASDWPRCSSFAASRCCRMPSVAARAMPTDTAALPSWNQGSTTFIITAKPSPSPLTRWEAGTATSSSRSGALALPRRPRPFHDPPTLRPGTSRGR